MEGDKHMALGPAAAGACKLLAVEFAPHTWTACAHCDDTASHKHSVSRVTMEVEGSEDDESARGLDAGPAAMARSRSDPIVDGALDEAVDLSWRDLLTLRRFKSEPVGALSSLRLETPLAPTTHRKLARSSYTIPVDGQGTVDYDDFFSSIGPERTLRTAFLLETMSSAPQFARARRDPTRRVLTSCMDGTDAVVEEHIVAVHQRPRATLNAV